MKRACLLLVILFALSACERVNTSINEKTTPVVGGDSTAKDVINTKIPSITPETLSIESPDFLADDERDLSVWDFETAYEMCTKALSEYYKVIYNGSDMDLDSYIDNENLKQYMQKKITSQYDLRLKNNLIIRVTGIDMGAGKVEYVGEDTGFLYLKVYARVNMDVGSFAEPTEFLVQNSNGRLVIADWYTSAKDSHDSTVRGGNQTIDDPDIWNNLEWVRKMVR